jgi:hypothetical protein
MAPKILALFFLVAGCAGVNRQVKDDLVAEEESATDDESPSTTAALAMGKSPVEVRKIACAHEHPTGSHIAKLVCREEDEVDKTAQRTQLILQILPKTVQCNDSGCQGTTPGSQ